MHFGFKQNKSDEKNDHYTDIMTAVKKYFIPEFLNRIDEVIVFNALSKDDLYHIIELQLIDLRKNLDKKNNLLKITKSAKEDLIRSGLHREWGARPLRRLIQNNIENAISARFLSGDFKENGIIMVKSKNKDLVFTQKLKKRSKTPKINKNLKSLKNQLKQTKIN